MNMKTTAETQAHQLAVLQLAGEHLDGAPGTRDLAKEVLKAMGLTDAEIAAAEAKAFNIAPSDALDNIITESMNPRAVAQASRRVAQLLVTNQITPDQGRTTLYALQVCLSALRIAGEEEPPECGDGRPRPSKRSEAPQLPAAKMPQKKSPTKSQKQKTRGAKQ